MRFLVPCPSCGRTLAGTPSAFGYPAACPSCRSAVWIPPPPGDAGGRRAGCAAFLAALLAAVAAAVSRGY